MRPQLGFGVSGPLSTALVSRNQTVKLLNTAWDAGVRFFDTAPSYGAGEAEKRLGLALKEFQPDQVFVSTKAGLDERKQRDFSPSNIIESLHRSMNRLGVDCVDLLCLHGPSPEELSDELLLVLQSCKTQGKLKSIGIATRGNVISNIDQIINFDWIMLPLGATATRQNIAMAKAGKASGKKVIGIEMLAGSRNNWKLSLNPADYWYMARALRYGSIVQNSEKTAINMLQNALNDENLDVVLSSSTKKEHIVQWSGALDALAGTT